VSAPRWSVGIDIGGTNLVAGVVPVGGGEPMALRIRATQPERGPDAIVTDVVRMARESLREVWDARGGGPAEVLGVGVGCPGPVHRATGTVVESPNLRWKQFPLRERIQAFVDWPVNVDNDANCATYGEWWQGAGQGLDSMVGIIIGTGVGGGYIEGGRLVHGASDGAGEIGHTTVNVSGRRCACGNYGCLEAYAAGPAIAARAREGIEAGATSALFDLVDGDLERISAATVYEAVVGGDPFATEVMTEAARVLGVGVANIINMLNPAGVVIMGGVTRAGEHLLQPLREEVRRRAFRGLVDACQLLTARLPETAGVVGAVGLLEATLAGDPSA
jgi:glucokinase